MIRQLTILKYSIYSLCFLFVLDSCATPSEKKVHKTYTVEIKQMKFQPAELIIQKGDTVIWINRDMVAHDVTEQPDRSWASSTLLTGQSWKLVATQSADYYCSIHVVMKGKLVVQ